MSYTATQKLEAIRREIKYRERVFPRLVEQGKMKSDFATFQIDIMREIERDYEQQADSERLV